MMIFDKLNVVADRYPMQREEKGSKIRGISRENAGPRASKTTTILRKVLTSSTCGVVNGPPYLSLAKSILGYYALHYNYMHCAKQEKGRSTFEHSDNDFTVLLGLELK